MGQIRKSINRLRGAGGWPQNASDSFNLPVVGVLPLL